MRFLLDMNISSAVTETLRADGHDVIHAGELGMGNRPDRDLFAEAVAQDRVLITFDLDFGDIVGSAAPQGPGLLLLRLRSPRRPHMLDRLQVAIAMAADALENGAIVLVEDSRIRIRRLDASE